MRYCSIHWQYSQLVVPWYSVTTYDLPGIYIVRCLVLKLCQKIRLMETCDEYMTPTSASVRTGGMERNEVRPPISHVVVYIPCILKKSVHNYAIFSSFYCSMETPTIIRVGTRNYITRIALYHKNMYWYTCITRKVTRPENDMVFV